MKAYGIYCKDQLWQIRFNEQIADDAVKVKQLTQTGDTAWRVLPIEITETGLQRAKQEHTTEPE